MKSFRSEFKAFAKSNLTRTLSEPSLTLRKLVAACTAEGTDDDGLRDGPLDAVYRPFGDHDTLRLSRSN